MHLKDKNIVITGGSKGLGRALAEEFIANGAKVIITGKNKSVLEKTAKDIGAIPLILDVRNEKEVQKIGKSIIKKVSKIDIWINNAGIWLPHVAIEKMNMGRVHDMVEVNLFGTIYGSKFALQQMRKHKGGIIVNILSTSALTGRAHSSGYCASKYAATGFTNSLRLEVEKDNIKVISVYPGGMRTSFFDEAKPGNYDEYMDPSYVAKNVINNIKKAKPKFEQIIKRPT